MNVTMLVLPLSIYTNDIYNDIFMSYLASHAMLQSTQCHHRLSPLLTRTRHFKYKTMTISGFYYLWDKVLIHLK